MHLVSRRTVAISAFAVLAFACSGGGGGAAPVAPTLAFDAPTFAATGGANGRGVTVCDVDHDGIADVLVANETFASVSFLKGRPNGSFAAGALIAAPASVANIAAADVDGDRLLDLIASSGAGAVTTFSHGNGDGTFAAGTPVNLPWVSRKIVLADWTGDGKVDLIASSAISAEIAMLPGDGAGGFGPAVRLATLFSPADFVIADVNADGRPDLVYTGVGAVRLVAIRNDGAGGFLPAVVTTVTAQGGRLAAFDFDGDRVADLVTLDATLTRIDVFRGTGAGAFAAVSDRAIATMVIDSFALGDLDGDGKTDLVAAAGSQVFASYGLGAGEFSGVELLATDGLGATSVALHDTVGDGTIDAFFMSGSTRIGVLRNPRRTPVGLVGYGTGTPDCGGRIGMWANGSPRVGNRDYGFSTTNAPPQAVGVLLQGGPADVAGSDPLGVGVLVHIGFGLLTTQLVFSDPLGSCFVPQPVPDAPGLVGLPVYVQTLWQADLSHTCSTSPAGFVSSVALTSTIQP